MPGKVVHQNLTLEVVMLNELLHQILPLEVFQLNELVHLSPNLEVFRLNELVHQIFPLEVLSHVKTTALCLYCFVCYSPLVIPTCEQAENTRSCKRCCKTLLVLHRPSISTVVLKIWPLILFVTLLSQFLVTLALDFAILHCQV